MKIALTGGGTAGHAMVGSILIPLLVQAGWNAFYIGSHAGTEKHMIQKQGLAHYYTIPTGKLRRYFSLQNLIDPFKILAGIIQAYSILRKERPHVIFSGGGYVSVPVICAAFLRGIPILLRETDYTIGLANRICLRFAKEASVTFADTAKQIQSVPVKNHGLIIRATLLQVSSQKVAFIHIKPVLLVMGGSLGAVAINHITRHALPVLLSQYNIVHLCGKGHMDKNYNNIEGYLQLEFLEDMAASYTTADIILMRCGSNAICEGLALGKRMICVPLTKSGSRGEQYNNAQFAVQHGNAVILDEENLSAKSIFDAAAVLLKEPAKNQMMLTSQKLTHNCMAQIEQLHRLASSKRTFTI